MAIATAPRQAQKATGVTTGRRRQPNFSTLYKLYPAVSGRNQSDWESIRDELLQQEVGFIHNAEFDTLSWAKVQGEGEDIRVFDDHSSAGKASRVTVDLPPYLSRLYAVPLLTADGEQLLFRKMNYLKFWGNVLRSRLRATSVNKSQIARVEALLAEADSVRNQIAQANLRLVVSIARKFSNSRQEFDDLVSEGNMILINAVEKFDYSRGFRFSTYTTHAVQRHFYRRWQTMQRRRQAVQSAPQEIMDEVPHVRDDTQFDPGPIKQLEKIINRFDECLDDRERRIVVERFGLGKSEVARTLRQIAEDLGISKERVRQLQFKAIDKLRQVALEMGVSWSPA